MSAAILEKKYNAENVELGAMLLLVGYSPTLLTTPNGKSLKTKHL